MVFILKAQLPLRRGPGVVKAWSPDAPDGRSGSSLMLRQGAGSRGGYE